MAWQYSRTTKCDRARHRLFAGSVLRLPLSDLKQMSRQPAASASVSRTLAIAEREHILEVLKQTDGLIGGSHGAASRLGLPRTTLVYKMRKLGIQARRLHRTRSGHPAGDGLDGTGCAPSGASKEPVPGRLSEIEGGHEEKARLSCS